MAQALAGKVALVAGATRGAGRGIACMLGEAGATVYCSSRSTRQHPCTTGYYAGRPETIEGTAELVARHGGEGIAVRTDHLAAEQIQALVDKIRKDHGRLDILVNDISEGEPHPWKPFWRLDIEKGFRMLRSALHSHILTARSFLAVAPVRLKSGGLFSSRNLARDTGSQIWTVPSLTWPRPAWEIILSRKLDTAGGFRKHHETKNHHLHRHQRRWIHRPQGRERGLA